MRWLSATLLTVLALACGLSAVAQMREPVWQKIPQLDVDVGVALRAISHLNEFERALVVRSGDREAKFELYPDWGPADLVNVYVTPGGDLGFAEASGERLIHLSDFSEARTVSGSASWTYVGAFDMIDTFPDSETGYHRIPRLMFVPPDVRGECAPPVDVDQAKHLGRRNLWQACKRIWFYRNNATWDGDPG